MVKKIKFTKMHGAGNDYIYVYTPEFPITHPSIVSSIWSRPHFGIGSDGLILIGTSELADFNMRIFNNDGTEAMMCGNGIRCAAKFVYDHNLTDKTTISFDTLSGIKEVTLKFTENEVTGATVDMGEPIMSNTSQLLTEDGSLKDGIIKTCNGKEFRGTYVCMGNPHFVVFTSDLNKINLAEDGKLLEYHELFPERCNIEFVEIYPNNTLRMKVWERGSGITLACGTGACATAVAAAITGKRGRSSMVEMDGGTLYIDWKENNHVYMTGPAVTVYEGEILLEE